MAQRDNIARHLNGKPAGNQSLMFDPRTGELVVVDSGERRPSPDSVVADQVASDGFF